MKHSTKKLLTIFLLLNSATKAAAIEEYHELQGETNLPMVTISAVNWTHSLIKAGNDDYFKGVFLRNIKAELIHAADYALQDKNYQKLTRQRQNQILGVAPLEREEMVAFKFLLDFRQLAYSWAIRDGHGFSSTIEIQNETDGYLREADREILERFLSQINRLIDENKLDDARDLTSVLRLREDNDTLRRLAECEAVALVEREAVTRAEREAVALVVEREANELVEREANERIELEAAAANTPTLKKDIWYRYGAGEVSTGQMITAINKLIELRSTKRTNELCKRLYGDRRATPSEKIHAVSNHSQVRELLNS